MQMNGLDLSFAADEKHERTGKKIFQDKIQEELILVIFDLPDGSQGESNFKLGQTVEYLKSYVETEYSIPMDSQRLFIEEKLMIDPLSLLDYPEAKGVDEIYIRVEGNLPKSESKK